MKVFVQGCEGNALSTWTWHLQRAKRDRMFYKNIDERPKGTIVYKGTVEIEDTKHENKITNSVEKWLEENKFDKAFKERRVLGGKTTKTEEK